MIDEIIAMMGEMFGLLFHAIKEITIILSKAFYNFLKKHPRYIFLLPFLLVVAYLRLHYIATSANFLGINMQDLQIVLAIFRGNLVLLGRPLLPGNLTLGPFYNYFIAPVIWLFGSNPVGPAYVASILSIATAYLLYLIGKQFFNLQAGIFAAGLYAVSPFVISYTNLSWNVDILPFFSLLLLWAVFNAAASARPFLYYIIAGYLLGICLQLHYVALFLLVLIPLYMVTTEILVKGKRFLVPLLLHLIDLLAGFLISLLPFFYSEILTGFTNIKTLQGYLTTTAHNTNLMHMVLSIPLVLFTLFERLIIHFPSSDALVYYSPLQVTMLGYFALFLLVFSLLILIIGTRNKFVLMVLLFWLLFGSFDFSFFKNDMYDDHLTLLYPVCFLLVGNFLASMFRFANQERVKLEKQLISHTEEGETYTMIPVDVTNKNKLLLHRFSIGMSIVIFFIIVLLNFSVLTYRYQSKTKLAQITAIATFIIAQDNSNPFNFALIANPNTLPAAYDAALKKLKNEPITIQHPEIDPDRKTVTQYLYVVCENQACNPLESNLWDIQGFGSAAILSNWTIQGVTVYKLVHQHS